MFSTPEFWVFIAFLLFLAGIGKKALAFLTQALDDHRQKVVHQLDEAQRLHDEALSLLNSYKKKNEEATQQAAKIVSFAKTEALELQKTSEHSFEKFMEQKEKNLLERIAIEKEEAKSQLRQQTLEEALTIVKNLLAKEPKEKKKLTEASLKEIAALPLTPKPIKKRSKKA